MLKEIVRDNLLFDENNPSMKVGDAPLEAALGKKEVRVNEVQGVVQRQLVLVEASQGPLGEGMLAGSLAIERAAPSNPRPETRAVTTQANIPSGRVVGFSGISSGTIAQELSAQSRMCPHSGGVAVSPRVCVRPLNHEQGAAEGSRLSREAAESISQIIVTLTLLLASAGPTNGFLAYSCGNLRNAVAGYALALREG
jgi:hypothetical protein